MKTNFRTANYYHLFYLVSNSKYWPDLHLAFRKTAVTDYIYNRSCWYAYVVTGQGCFRVMHRIYLLHDIFGAIIVPCINIYMQIIWCYNFYLLRGHAQTVFIPLIFYSHRYISSSLITTTAYRKLKRKLSYTMLQRCYK